MFVRPRARKYARARSGCPPPSLLQAKGSGRTAKEQLEWTYVPTGYFTDDYFPKVPGPLSATEVPKQMKVLKGYTFRGQKGDLLSAFQVLYPGNMMDHVEKVFARMKQENSNTAALTAGEWLQKQSGHAAKAKRPRAVGPSSLPPFQPRAPRLRRLHAPPAL